MIAIGVDIGGTNTKMVAISSGGRLIKEHKFKTFSFGRSFPDFAEGLGRILNEWKKNMNRRDLVAGIGVAGDVNAEKGILRFSPNLAGWRNVRISSAIKKRVSLKCWVRNDANMAAWGAYVLEVGGKYDTGIVLTMGTGIGGGIICKGEIYEGATSTAGEFGHMKIYPGGRKCNCGEKGCLEAYIGSYAIIKRANEKIKDPIAFAAKFGKKRLTTSCLAAAAERGEPTALALWKETGKYLGIGLANIVYALNPEFIVIAGGVSRSWKFFMPYLKKVFAGQKIVTPFRKVEVIISKKADLGVYGAALYALHKAKNEKN